jgi:predicted amidohydrolase YtcJ
MARATVFDNATVLSMVPGRASARAIAFADGRILAVGDGATVIAGTGPDPDVIDLAGRAVCPGFIDAHQHFSLAAIERDCVDCSPALAPSIEAIQQRLRNAASTLPDGAWVVGLGYDEFALREQRHPIRDDLDAACPRHPVLLCHYSAHEAVANSRALEAGRIDRHTPDPSAGIIARTHAGEPNGRLIETAFSRLHMIAHTALVERDPDTIYRQLRRYQNDLFAVGITRVCDATVSPCHEQVYQQARDNGHLPMPIVMMAASAEGLLCPPWDRLDAAGPRTGDGPEHLRTGPLKLFFDGANRCMFRMTIGQVAAITLRILARAIRSRSTGVLQSTGDLDMRLGRDLRVRTGVQFFTVEDGHRMIERACELGFAIAIHAIGNSAVDQAIEALGRVRSKHRDVPPPRIEHATFITPEAARRAADFGIAVAAQPGFVDLPVFHVMPTPGAFRVLAHRTLIDAGVRVAGSSDAPVIGFDPLAAMRAAVSRRSRSRAEVHPEEAIRPDEALALYTREAAHALGSLDVTGTLEPGKRADLVVLSEDPTTSATALFRTRLERTVLAGEAVYSAGFPS